MLVLSPGEKIKHSQHCVFSANNRDAAVKLQSDLSVKIMEKVTLRNHAQVTIALGAFDFGLSATAMVSTTH